MLMSETGYNPGKEPDQPNSTPEKDGLTGIPRRIHYVATSTDGYAENDTGNATIDCFLDALADVAPAAASRRIHNRGNEG